MVMTINEAIQDLEVRKRMLQKKSCLDRWDPAIEMALQALKEKRDHPIILCKNCRFSTPEHPEMGLWLCKLHKLIVLLDDYCSDAEAEDE